MFYLEYMNIIYTSDMEKIYILSDLESNDSVSLYESATADDKEIILALKKKWNWSPLQTKNWPEGESIDVFI